MTFADSCALLSCRIFPSFCVRKKLFSVSAGKLLMDRRNEAKSTMELVNIPPIVSIYRQALTTFGDSKKQDLTVNLNKLKGMMDSLRAVDLGLDKTMNMLNAEAWKKPNKAPCTYIEVFQNTNINMSIFVLKPGFKMPLHDHPHMNGLLKVLWGAVHIRSFTEYPLTEVVKREDIPARAKLEAQRISKGTHKHRKLFAAVSNDSVCTDITKTCTLTPSLSNYHEIQALEAPAAFFDILSPPYDTFIEGIGPRRCRYYQVANELSINVVQLQETAVPDCFYCDQAPYLGPQLT